MPIVGHHHSSEGLGRVPEALRMSQEAIVLRTPSIVVTGIVLGVAGLTGCVPSDAPHADASASASTAGSLDTPSSGQPVQAPTRPASTTINSADDAQRWLDYVSDALDYAYLTGDTAPINAVTSSECSRCIQEFVTISDLYEHGGSSDAPQATYRVTEEDGEGGGTRRVTVEVSTDAVTQVNADGEVLREIPALQGGEATTQIELTRTGDRWMISELPGTS